VTSFNPMTKSPMRPTKLIVTLGVLCIIIAIGYYAGSSNPWRDLACLVLSLGLTAILAKLSRRAIGLFKAGAEGARRYSCMAATYLCISWAVLSVSDCLFERHSIPIDSRQRIETLSSNLPKIGLALSGGGYRAALFHAGVLAELDNIGIRTSVMSTVSGGSIIGAFYAKGGRPEAFLKAVIGGDFNLERRTLRMDNAVRLLFGALRYSLPRLVSPHGSEPADSFTTTKVQAQMLDDLFLNGALLAEAGSSRVAQMICATDIANSEILGVTSRGALIRSIDNSLDRAEFSNPTRKASDFIRFEPDSVVGLPGQTRWSVLVAASGAFPGPFPPIRIKRWTLTDGFGGVGLLADGGLGDNSGVSQLDDMQYLASTASDPSNRPDTEWRVPIILVSDGSALSGRFLSAGNLSDISRAVDIIYKATGGPALFGPHSNAGHSYHARLVLLSPHTIARKEGELNPDRNPSALWGYEKQTGYPVIVFGKPTEITVEGMSPLTISLITDEAWQGLAAAMPAATSQRATILINNLLSKHLLTRYGILTASGTSPLKPEELTSDETELANLLVSDINLTLKNFIRASTLKDHFDRDEAESIYRLGRYVVRLNQPFINCEIGKLPCVVVK
jgi:predicted acylesterase/phospholipase RssA